MRILGIDPGIAGGIALVEGNAVIFVQDLPVVGEKAKQRVNACALWQMLTDNLPIDHAFIERAQAMPKQGASSGFKYGRVVGCIEAVVMVLGIPLTIVEPTKWKKHYQLKGGDKENSRQRALMLFPHASALLSRKMDHGRAEAILIARYGAPMLPLA